MSKHHVIFVIDDSPIISELLVHVLTKELNARILSFDSCESALSAIEKITPDLILLDYHLNSWKHDNMSGKDFLIKMKQRNQQAAVIAISGQNDKTVSVDLLQLGAIDYISKSEETFIEDIVDTARRTLSFLDLKKNERSLASQVPDHIKKGSILLLVLTFITLLILWLT